jgi:hypothetical protein
MKFLIIVLVIHFIAEIFSNRKNKPGEKNEGEKIIHPAEYEVR